jgi:hypothetical protein
LTRDVGALPRLKAWLAEDRYDLSALDGTLPVLRVDTTDGYAPAFEEIVAFAQTGGRGGSAALPADG